MHFISHGLISRLVIVAEVSGDNLCICNYFYPLFIILPQLSVFDVFLDAIFGFKSAQFCSHESWRESRKVGDVQLPISELWRERTLTFLSSSGEAARVQEASPDPITTFPHNSVRFLWDSLRDVIIAHGEMLLTLIYRNWVFYETLNQAAFSSLVNTFIKTKKISNLLCPTWLIHINSENNILLT